MGRVLVKPPHMTTESVVLQISHILQTFTELLSDNFPITELYDCQEQYRQCWHQIWLKYNTL